MWKLAPYLRLVRASALYDLLVTAPFATPWSLAWLLRQLDALGQWLGFAPLAGFPPEALLLGNLLGSLVCVWSVLRLVRPSLLLGRRGQGPVRPLAGLGAVPGRQPLAGNVLGSRNRLRRRPGVAGGSGLVSLLVGLRR